MNTASCWTRSRRMFFKSLQLYTLLEGTMTYNDFTLPIILMEQIMIFLLYFITQYVYAINTHITCSLFDMTKIIFSKNLFLRSNLQSHSFDPASPSTHLCPSQAIKQNSNWLNVLDLCFRKKSACPLDLDLMQNVKHRKNCECCPGHYLIVDHYSSI